MRKNTNEKEPAGITQQAAYLLITRKRKLERTHAIFGLLGPKPCKNCESRMSEANPRQSLVKGERLIRYELASAITNKRCFKQKPIFKCGRRSGRESQRVLHQSKTWSKTTLYATTCKLFPTSLKKWGIIHMLLRTETQTQTCVRSS